VYRVRWHHWTQFANETAAVVPTQRYRARVLAMALCLSTSVCLSVCVSKQTKSLSVTVSGRWVIGYTSNASLCCNPRRSACVWRFKVAFTTHGLVDGVVVLRPTGHKTGHFGDVSPSQSDREKPLRNDLFCVEWDVKYTVYGYN